MKVLIAAFLYFLLVLVVSEPMVRNAFTYHSDFIKEMQKEKENTEDKTSSKELNDDSDCQICPLFQVATPILEISRSDNFHTKELEHLFKISSEINPPEYC